MLKYSFSYRECSFNRKKIDCTFTFEDSLALLKALEFYNDLIICHNKTSCYRWRGLTQIVICWMRIGAPIFASISIFTFL